MEDFDLLYLLKTPLFIGSADKVVSESESVDLNTND
jgi:hypothetical protein